MHALCVLSKFSELIVLNITIKFDMIPNKIEENMNDCQ